MEQKRIRSAKKGEPGYWERPGKISKALEAGKRGAIAREALKKYKSPEQLQEKIDEYFNRAEESGEVVSEHGLARYLGVSRSTLYNWWKGTQCSELHETVVCAYDRLAECYMQLLKTGDKNMTSFVIFTLKQLAFGGYQDKIETKQDTTVKIIHGDTIDESDFK